GTLDRRRRRHQRRVPATALAAGRTADPRTGRRADRAVRTPGAALEPHRRPVHRISTDGRPGLRGGPPATGGPPRRAHLGHRPTRSRGARAGHPRSAGPARCVLAHHRARHLADLVGGRPAGGPRPGSGGGVGGPGRGAGPPRGGGFVPGQRSGVAPPIRSGRGGTPMSIRSARPWPSSTRVRRAGPAVAVAGLLIAASVVATSNGRSEPTEMPTGPTVAEMREYPDHPDLPVTYHEALDAGTVEQYDWGDHCDTERRYNDTDTTLARVAIPSTYSPPCVPSW